MIAKAHTNTDSPLYLYDHKANSVGQFCNWVGVQERHCLIVLLPMNVSYEKYLKQVWLFIVFASQLTPLHIFLAPSGCTTE